MENQPQPSHADVVVIGGGIVGCAAAYYLSLAHVKVVLVERGEIAGEQSSRAWGFVRQQGRHPAEIPLAKAASAIWESLAGRLQADIEFVRNGIIALGASDADMQSLEEGARNARKHGLSTRLIGPQEIAQILPQLAGKWRGGLFTPDDGHAEPVKATRALADAARRLGAVILTRCPVLEIETAGGQVSGVRTLRGLIKANTVICAAGISAAQLVEPLGLSLPVRLTRSSVSETKPTQVFTRVAVWGPDVAYRPTQRGTFYLGNGYRGAGADYDITLASFRHLRLFLPSYRAHWRRLKLRFNAEFFWDLGRRLSWVDAKLPEPKVNRTKITYNEQQFYRLFPHLAGLGLQRAWAGRIDVTPDAIPAIGPVRTVGGLLLATGFSGHGFALGPIAGTLLSEWVVKGWPSIDLAAFDPHRFEHGPTGPARIGI